jgi:hypothetical protein
MKTSTMLITSAVIIILISLVAYNFSLRASYLKGDYKNPYYGLEFTPVQGINELSAASSNHMVINVNHGKKEGIWMSDRVKDKIVFKESNGILSIDLSKAAKDDEFKVFNKDLILVINKPVKITTTPYFKVPEYENSYIFGKIILNNFQQDSLIVDLGKSGAVILDNLHLKKLKALVGKDKGSANLVLSAGTYHSADFNIPGKGKIELLNPVITQTRYDVSDAATVTLNGGPLKIINKN